MYKTNAKKKLILIACGGTAGHISPGMALAERLASRYKDSVRIMFITTDNKMAGSIFANSPFDFYALPGRGLKKKGALIQLIKGLIESMKIVFTERPSCLVGFGSYISGPPFVAASMAGVPTIVHEQNVVLGKANRIMRHFATRVAVSFPVTAAAIKKDKAVVTGNPIRDNARRRYSKTDALSRLQLRNDRLTILVLGGSQGAHSINMTFIEMLKGLDKETAEKIQVIHLTGDGDYEAAAAFYSKSHIKVRIFWFFEDMGLLYSAADMAISRAGASSVWELCHHNIPSILIPYPFAGDHQRHNADFLAKRDSAIVIKEDMLSATQLMRCVEAMTHNRAMRLFMSDRMKPLADFDSTDKLADEIGSLVKLGRGNA